MLRELEPDNPLDIAFLWNMLDEREPEQNISFKMPTLEEHKKFLKSNPYHKWYIIEESGEPIGNCYITEKDEIGYFILKKYQRKGYATKAIIDLAKLSPRGAYYANINPQNQASIRFLYNKFKATPRQVTMEMKINSLLL